MSRSYARQVECSEEDFLYALCCVPNPYAKKSVFNVSKAEEKPVPSKSEIHEEKPVFKVSETQEKMPETCEDDVAQRLFEEAEGCCVCGRSISECLRDADLEFYFDEQGRLYCMDHYRETTLLALW